MPTRPDPPGTTTTSFTSHAHDKDRPGDAGEISAASRPERRPRPRRDAEEDWPSVETPLLRDGKDIRVGVLKPSFIPSRTRKRRSCVFISHTNRDNVKRLIAHPTYSFIKDNLNGVDAFLDELDAERGMETDQAIARAAYASTHALVVISPSFRERRYCVLELNTFMKRRRNKDNMEVLPALWNVKNLAGYAEAVSNLIWLVNTDTVSPVEYMVQWLWPALSRKFGSPEKTRSEYELYLCMYIEKHRGEGHAIPAELEAFANRYRELYPARPASVPGKDLQGNNSSLLPSSGSNKREPEEGVYKVYVHDRIRSPDDLKLLKASEIFKLKGNLTPLDRYFLNEGTYPIQNIETRDIKTLSQEEISQLCVDQFAVMSNRQLEDFTQEQVSASFFRVRRNELAEIVRDRRISGLSHSCTLVEAVKFRGFSAPSRPPHRLISMLQPRVGETESYFSDRTSQELQSLIEQGISKHDMVYLEEEVAKAKKAGQHKRLKYSYGEMVLVPRSNGEITYGTVVSNSNGKHALEWDRQDLRQWLRSRPNYRYTDEGIRELPDTILNINVTRSDMNKANVSEYIGEKLLEDYAFLKTPEVLEVAASTMEVKSAWKKSRPDSEYLAKHSERQEERTSSAETKSTWKKIALCMCCCCMKAQGRNEGAKV